MTNDQKRMFDKLSKEYAYFEEAAPVPELDDTDTIANSGPVLTTGSAGVAYFKQMMDGMISSFGTSASMGTTRWVGMTSTTSTTPAFAWSVPSPDEATYPYLSGSISKTPGGKPLSILDALRAYLQVTNCEIVYLRFNKPSHNVSRRNTQFKGRNYKYHACVAKPFYDPALYPKAVVITSRPYYTAGQNYNLHRDDLYVEGKPTPLLLTALKNTNILPFKNVRQL
jgi:hypothetical protein